MRHLAQALTFSTGGRRSEVRLHVTEGLDEVGEIALKRHSQGWVEWSGTLSGDQGFWAVRSSAAESFGLIQLPALGAAYILTDGRWRKVPIAEAVCHALASPRSSGGTPVIMANETVPTLESRPGASAVIYIDFDGASVTDPHWNGGRTIAVPDSGIASGSISRIWKGVADRFSPFNVNVTTIAARYNSAPVGRRMRCMVSSSTFGNNSAAGLALLNSWSQAGRRFSATVPCWAFVNSGTPEGDLTLTIAHEVGHALGLSHDGFANPRAEYHHGTLGNLSFDTSEPFYRWQPIMGGGGSSTGFTLRQWSKGGYPNANNKEDDLAIIASGTNGMGFSADEDRLGITDVGGGGLLDVRTHLQQASDVDAWSFHMEAGILAIQAGPDHTWSTVDAKVRVVDDVTGQVVVDEDPVDTQYVDIEHTLPRGRYRLEIMPAGNGDRYPAYGSVGEVRVRATFPRVANAPPIVLKEPVGGTQPVGSRFALTVAALSNTPLSYQWQRNGEDLPAATSATLVITKTLLRDAGSYRCVIANSAGSATSAEAVLMLSYQDTTKPKVALLYPRTASVMVEGSPHLVISGSASDETALVAVEVSLNGTAFSPASLLLDETWLKASYSQAVTLRPGLNHIETRSRDTRGNLSPVARSVVEYRVVRPLTVQKVGSGTLPRPFPGTDSTRKLGFSYTLTAKALPGQLFDRWENNGIAGTSITPASSEHPTLTFVHREGLVLTAHFVPTPYSASVIGNYTGIITPSTTTPAPSGTQVAHDTHGLVTLQLSGTGGFTARITRGISAWSVAGLFDSRGDAVFGTNRSKNHLLTRSSLPPLRLSMRIIPGSHITGSIIDEYRNEVAGVSDFTLQHSAFSRLAPVPADLASTTSRSYSLTITQSTSDPAFGLADYPQTTGTSKLRLYTDGRVLITGKLADSTTFTSTGQLTTDFSWPCYVRLYSSKGSVSARLQITAPDVLTTAYGFWFRPFIRGATYPWGWPEGLTLRFNTTSP